MLSQLLDSTAFDSQQSDPENQISFINVLIQDENLNTFEFLLNLLLDTV